MLAALGALAAVPAAGSAAPSAANRYSLAGGCFALKSAAGSAVAGTSRLRMQATALGSYLLYGPDRTFLAAHEDGSVGPAAAPSPAADWRVTAAGPGRFRLSPASAPSRALVAGQGGTPALGGPDTASRLRFSPASGCAIYPEAGLGASGRPARGPTPYGAVSGLIEGHMHWMTFEYFGGNFHCGKPWDRYGIAYALPDCSSIEGPQGTAASFQNFLNYGNPAQPHDTSGYPKLTEFGNSNLTYEGTYWRWIQRAWAGGLRLMVMSINENRELCQLQQRRRNSCDEMSTVRKGFQDIHELEDYVDAQAGGPGKGFFQIVTTPNQARRVINQGRMAVVLEIEVSELFGCHGSDASSCTRAKIDRGLDEMYKLGVRSSLLLNKFDNPLVGVRFDGGPVGQVINAANRDSYGSFWSAETCTGKLHDNTIESGGTSNPALSGLLQAAGAPGGVLPTYPPAPHCNTRGLTALGRYLVEKMMDRHMIVNPDHMSQAGVTQTLSLLEARRYSGVISPHGWMDPGNWPRLWKLGGVAFPGHSSATEYVKDYEKYRPLSTPYKFGWGYGADLGGLSHQPDAPKGSSISYPFRSQDGKVSFQPQRTGDRTFDYRKDGVATYGQYPEWFADLRRLGGARLTRDMSNGAEAYLEMWERAQGIRTRECAGFRSRILPRGLPRIRLGAHWQSLLARAGQPQQRARAWSYCVAGTPNRRAADVAELTPGGHVELVASQARARAAGGVPVGAAVARLRRAGARPVGGGVYVKSAGRTRFVYAARGGRVRLVAVASRALAARRAALRAAVRRALSARAIQAHPVFKPNPATEAARITGRGLAIATSDPRLDRAFRLLCSLAG